VIVISDLEDDLDFKLVMDRVKENDNTKYPNKFLKRKLVQKLLSGTHKLAPILDHCST